MTHTLARLPLEGKPANGGSWLNAGMTLQERLEEVMQAKGWDRADLVRVSGQSSSVVSQWLGKGSKIIHTIGRLEAAEALARESGYAALWIAKGIGPKLTATDQAGSAAPAKPLRSSPSGLQAVSDAVAALPAPDRGIAMAALAAWVQQGCPAESVPRLEALLGGVPAFGAAARTQDEQRRVNAPGRIVRLQRVPLHPPGVGTPREQAPPSGGAPIESICGSWGLF